MNTRLFGLDDSAETQSTAPVLQNKFANGYKPQSFTRDVKGGFASMSLAEMTSTAWLGHSHQEGDSNYIGDYKADSFAKKFTSEFEDRFGNASADKLQVRDIYIVGCETAFQLAGQRSLAQIIADELYKKGFTNVCVHAVAGPENNANFAGMRVKVYTKAGIMKMQGINDGHVTAYLLTAKQEKELDELQRQIDEANKQLTQTTQQRTSGLSKVTKGKSSPYRPDQLRTQAERSSDREAKQKIRDLERGMLAIEHEAMQNNSVMSTDDIWVELNQPQHTFHPTAVKAARKEDVKQQALDKINQRVIEYKDKGEEDKADVLKQLWRDVRGAGDDWRTKVQACVDKHYSGFKDKFVSSTRAMLLDIIKTQPGVAVHGNKSEDPQSLLGHVKKIATQVVQPTPATVTIDKMPDTMRDTLQAIADFIEVLKKEEANKPFRKLTKWFPLKHYKMQQLSALHKEIGDFYANPSNRTATDAGGDKEAAKKAAQAKLDAWIKLVAKAQEDKRLIESHYSHRTEHLLTNIIEGRPKQGIQDPKLKQEWKPEDRAKNKNTRRFV